MRRSPRILTPSSSGGEGSRATPIPTCYDLHMRPAAIALLLGLSGCPAPSAPPPDGTPDVAVAAVKDLGLVKNAALPTVVRDGGAAGRVGGKLLWTFGDTLFPFQASDGSQGRSSSGSYAEFTSPTTLTLEPVDTKGAPFQLLPFNDEEKAYNAASGRPDERYALWPTAVLPKGEQALILYTRLKVHPGDLSYEAVSTGWALVKPWETVAERYPEVFVAPEPQFHHAAALDAGDAYLYACATTGLCKVARATYTRVTERAAYTFWTGSGWSADVAGAVATVPGGTTGFSVAYNTYLERFVSVVSVPFSGRILLRTATRPEGPWSEPLAVTDVGATIYATVQHPELAAEAGKKVYVSYYRPLQAFQGELHLLEVTFE